MYPSCYILNLISLCAVLILTTINKKKAFLKCLSWEMSPQRDPAQVWELFFSAIRHCIIKVCLFTTFERIERGTSQPSSWETGWRTVGQPAQDLVQRNRFIRYRLVKYVLCIAACTRWTSSKATPRLLQGSPCADVPLSSPLWQECLCKVKTTSWQNVCAI